MKCNSFYKITHHQDEEKRNFFLSNGSIFIVDFNNSSTVHNVNVSFFKLNFQNTNTISLCVNQLIYRFKISIELQITSDIG